MEKKMEYQKLHHEFPPVWDRDSEILILGSFPSVRSREEGFFYGHPRNRFWEVVSCVAHKVKPVTIEEKKEFLLSSHIAVWDVIESCEICGSSDSSIRNVVPNDISCILSQAPIRRILANGRMAERLYYKYIFPDVQRPVVAVPSTSPANAVWTRERLIEKYKEAFYG